MGGRCVPLSNADKCRGYRIRKHDREMIAEIVRDTMRDTLRDTMPEIIQVVKEALATPSRHHAATPCPSNGSSPEVSPKDKSNPLPTPSSLTPASFEKKQTVKAVELNPEFALVPQQVVIPNLIRSLDSEFAELWPLFPRKAGKGKALEKYRAARKLASFDQILAAVRKHAIECQTTEKQFIPHPATWLYGQRWLDEESKPNGHGRHMEEADSNRNPDGSFTEEYERSRQEALQRLLAQQATLGST
jgi:hypothetical protein